jgi:hypothetical protein
MPSCIKVTFRSILDNLLPRDGSLAMARHSCRLWYMVKWSEDHVAVIGPFKTQTLVWLIDFG